jgi:hypothetical protein
MGWVFKDWWEKNKKKENKKRREKYRSDPGFREDAKDKAKQNYLARRKRTTPVDRRTIRSSDGTRYLSIGRIARLINRPIPTIRSYHKSGILPSTAVDSRNWRLYTTNQAKLLRHAFKALDDPSDSSVKSLADVSALVSSRWEE